MNGRVANAAVGMGVATVCTATILVIGGFMHSHSTTRSDRVEIEGGLYLAGLVWLVSVVSLGIKISLSLRPTGRRADTSFSLPPVSLVGIAAGSFALIGYKDSGFDVAAIAALAGVGLSFVYWGLGHR